MKDETRLLLAIVLMFGVLLGWSALQSYLAPPAPPPVADEAQDAAAPSDATAQPEDTLSPTDVGATESAAAPAPAQALDAKELTIEVNTPLVDLTLSTKGANLTGWALKRYEDNEGKGPYQMVSGVFEDGPVSGRLSVGGAELESSALTFAYEGERRIELAEGETKTLEFRWRGALGIEWTRRLTIRGDNYLIDVTDLLRGTGTSPGSAKLVYHSLMRPPQAPDRGYRTLPPEALLSAQGELQKETLEDLSEDNETLSREPFDGFAGVGLQYFLFAWYAEGSPLARAAISAPTSETARIEIALPEQRIPETGAAPLVKDLGVFLGPKDREILAQAAHGLPAAVDLGFFHSISEALLWVLTHLQTYVKDWGWSIIVLTILVRILLFPLSVWQFKSMRAMQEIHPAIKELREKYKGDPQRQQQEMMNLYRQHKVNPFGGCLPMLAQIPIFLGLYWALATAIELRRAEWMGTWIHDLSMPDPYYILPVAMTATTYFSMKLTPSPAADPTQQKIMQFMPLIFLIFFLKMPAGLMLYWSVSNLLSIGQQLAIRRKAAPLPAANAADEAAPPVEPPPSSEEGNESPSARRRRRRKK